MGFTVDGEACRNPSFLLRREWLETNGLGGYASGTLLTSHTRRYHGLLVANLPAPLNGRHVLLSKFEESVLIAGRETFLTQHQFAGGLFPPNVAPLSRFQVLECPTWTYDIGGVQLQRSLMLLPGRNAILVSYSCLHAAEPVRLRLKPFLAFRRNHLLMRENSCVNPEVQPIAHGCRMEPYAGMPPFFLHWSAAAKPALGALGLWYRGFEYPEEARRGYDFREDLFAPCVLELSLLPGRELFVAASTEDLMHLDLLWRRETRRRQQAHQRNLDHCRKLTRFPEEAGFVAQLMAAADQFRIITPAGRPALLAGYHWFEDWGRDTMISLPGIAFCTGRHTDGLAIIDAFLHRETDGFLPNFFNPDGTAAYNSVDASLWFFWTLQQFLRAGGALDRLREKHWPAMQRILAAYSAGCDTPLLRMNADGLLYAGSPDTQLTWMDAHVDGKPVTPRWGYAVEINALWFNAVAFAVELARALGDTSFRPPAPPDKLAAAFQRLFWLEREQYLADVIHDGDGVDTALRPNQIFAVSLPHTPLLPAQQRAVVDQVQRHLLTPCGLRTLAPTDPHYRSHYGGTVQQRDFAYHQGTVWPWLLGAFCEAYLRTHSDQGAAIAQVRHWLRPWQEQVTEAGLGTVSEIYDADPPHAPNGCISQAWSVAEIIRSYVLLWQAESVSKPEIAPG